jgi:hypothetical protein
MTLKNFAKISEFMTRDSFKLFFFIFFFWAFSLLAEADFGDYVYEIERQVAEEVKQELDLLWSGDRSTMRDEVEEIEMQFASNHIATIEDARTLILSVVEKLVQAINTREKIQPHLQIRPFSFKQVSVSIFFLGPLGPNADGSVAYAFSFSDLATTPSQKQIVYFSLDPFENNLILLLKEPYEEALQINKTPRNSKQSDYNQKIDIFLNCLAKQITMKYGLSTWGIGGKLINGIEEISATFKLDHKVSEPEARDMLIFVAKTILESVNANESLKPYLKKVPFPSHLLKLRILFEPPTPPYTTISSVTLNDDKINYTLKVVHPLEKGEEVRKIEEFPLYPETYQEAFEKVESTYPSGEKTDI